MLDDLFDLLGEDGVISYISAGNYSSDNDRRQINPADSESDYAVTVGAADINGKPAGFTDYGKTSVDVFGPGMNILSSVSGDVYFPAITDAVCDLENETLTLTGENLFEGSTLTYKRMAVDGTVDQPLPDEMTVDFAADGSKLVIHNAKELFSTYTAFTVTAKNGTKGTGKFFLVKGQDKLNVIQTHTELGGTAIPYLLTDADGRNLYGYNKFEGTVSRYDGEQFINYKNSAVSEAVKQHIINNGADAYTVYNSYTVTDFLTDVPVCENGVIYKLLIVYIPEDNETAPGGGEEIKYREETYLAIFDLNASDHRWHISRIADLPEDFHPYETYYRLVPAFYNGKFMCICDPGAIGASDAGLPVYSYDPAADEWTKEPDMPYVSELFDVKESNGKLYVMFGFDPDRTKTNEERILSSVWCFDGEKREQKRDDIKYVGRINDNEGVLYHSDAITAVENGFIFFSASVDGGGNLFLYNTDTDMIEPLYYTVFDSLCDARDQNHSCVATRDGIYCLYLYFESNEEFIGWKLCLIPADSGLYEDPYQDDFVIDDADGDGELTIVDVTLIQRYDIKKIKLSARQLKAADVDGDGEMTVIDATWIQRCLVGLPSPLNKSGNNES